MAICKEIYREEGILVGLFTDWQRRFVTIAQLAMQMLSQVPHVSALSEQAQRLP